MFCVRAFQKTKFRPVSCWFSSGNQLHTEFNRAVEALKNGEPRDVSLTTKAKIYGLFKQANSGPASGSRPSMFDPMARGKFDAWAALGSMSKEDAMKGYISEVKNIYDGKLPDATPSTPSQTTSTESNLSSGYEPLSLSEACFPRKMMKGQFSSLKFQTIETSLSASGVAEIRLNRPKRGNAFNFQMWNDLREVFHCVGRDSAVKVVILTGNSVSFSTGMDLEVFAEMHKLSLKEPCEARKREGVYHVIQFLQEAISAPETCPVPVLAQISGHCIGGAVDLITACDLRFCSPSASFSIKETDLGMVADIGTLQRLPGLVGQQRSRELTYTGRTFGGKEAEKMGLVLECVEGEEEGALQSRVRDVAETIAKKSPLAIRGIKKSILFTRDNPTSLALHHVQLWNSAFLQSADLAEAMQAALTKQTSDFSKFE